MRWCLLGAVAVLASAGGAGCDDGGDGDADADTDTETDAEPDADADSDPDVDPDQEIDADIDLDFETGLDADGETDLDASDGGEADTDTGPSCLDTPLLGEMVQESVNVLRLLTDPGTGLAHESTAARPGAGCRMAPGFWVMSQAPGFDLGDVWSGLDGAVEATWDARCPSCGVVMRLDFDLPTPEAYAGITLPLGGLPRHGTTLSAVDLHRFDTLRIRWCVEAGAESLDSVEVKLQALTPTWDATDEVVAPLLLTESSVGGCWSPDAWTETDIPLSAFGDAARLSRVTRIIFGANGARIRSANVLVDRIWFLVTDAARRASTTASCTGTEYPDLACGASVTTSDTAALSLMAIAAGVELGLVPRATALDLLERAITSLERLPRWTGRPGEITGLTAGSEGAPVEGLPPDTFDPVSLSQSPRDREINLSHAADEVAALLALHAILEDWSDEALAARAETLGRGAWAALGRLTERGREIHGGLGIYGTVLTGRDMEHPGYAPGVVPLRHVARLDDTTLGSALCVGIGACARADWDSQLAAVCPPTWTPACPAPCDDAHPTRDGYHPGGLCFWQAQDGTMFEWMPTCFHDASPGSPCGLDVSGDPPYTAAGGLAQAFEAALFLQPDAHPLSGLRALPTPGISVGESARTAARAQLAFAREVSSPAWGWSNHANPASCTTLRELIGRCLEPDVVTPHALLLALEAEPEAACRALRFLTTDTPLGDDMCPLVLPGEEPVSGRPMSRDDVGPRDAIDLSAWRPGMTCDEARAAGAIRDVWLSRDVALGVLAYYNHYTGGRLRDLFERGGGSAVYDGLGTGP
jgi:hypothetical protein